MVLRHDHRTVCRGLCRLQRGRAQQRRRRELSRRLVGRSGVPAQGATGFAFSSIAGASRDGLPLSGVKIRRGHDAHGLRRRHNSAAMACSAIRSPAGKVHGGGARPAGGGDLYFELNSGGDDISAATTPSISLGTRWPLSTTTGSRIAMQLRPTTICRCLSAARSLRVRSRGDVRVCR